MPANFQPTILRQGDYTAAYLAVFKKKHAVWREIDVYTSQLKELFEITHPELLFSLDFEKKLQEFRAQRLGPLFGDWIYFPWSGRLVRSLPEADYFAVRTNRNKNLITAAEQETLKNFTVGVVGLSVGSNIATALAFSGISSTIKLAEFDSLETSNLNRIRARVDQVGQSKITIAVEQIYEVNPYADVQLFSEGITEETLTKFVTTAPEPKLLFEIIDSFEMKIHLRALAREKKIPVIMVTNLGDSVILDVERYDRNSKTEFFNGRAGSVPEEMVKNPDFTPQQKHDYAVRLAGVERIPKRALESVAEIGKTLVGRPQLTTTVTAATGLCAYFTRKIALGDSISGSWHIKFDDLFNPKTALTV